MKILFCTDGSRYALAAARFLSRWLSGPGVKVDLVSVIPGEAREGRPGYGKSRGVEDRSRGAAGRWQDRTADPLEGAGYAVKRVVRRGVPSRVLTELAGTEEYDLVVVGAKGRGDAPFLGMGSVALAVLEQTPSPVLMVREREAQQREKRVPSALHPFRLLLPTDGESHSLRASRRFFQIFRIEELEVEIVTVLHLPSGEEAPSRAEERRLRAEAERAARKHVNMTENELSGEPSQVRTAILEGDPAGEVTARAAEEHADLLVLGSRAVEALPGGRLGSVALEIARSAPCSVLVIRQPAP